MIPQLEEKQLEEELDLSNLTGGQIQEVLDFLIIGSLTPIVLASDIFNVQLAYLLSLTAQNKKRKLSALPREEFMSIASRALLVEDRQERVNLIATAKIERSFIYNFIVKFLKLAEGYRELYNDYLCAKKVDKIRLERKLLVLERVLSISRSKMLPALNISEDYLALAYRFRNSIVENYIKMAHKQAHAFVKLKGDNFDLQDVSQNFLTAVTKAIDKYDSSKGAITSYINYWVLNAQASSQDHDHEYGIAFTIPQLQRKKLAKGEKGDTNFSVSLNTLLSNNDEDSYELSEVLSTGKPSTEQQAINDEETHAIRYLAKRSDRKSLARLYLDIDEVMSRRELRNMAKTMQSQGLPLPHEARELLGEQQSHFPETEVKPVSREPHS